MESVRNLNVNIVLFDGGMVPEKATQGAAAYDLRIPCEYEIKPGRYTYPLNFKMSIPYGYEAIIDPRSGFSAKGFEGIDGARHNADVKRGKIDSDFRGTVRVIIDNHEDKPFTAAAGTRVAQLTFYKVEGVDFINSDSLDETERGDGGFNSTGTR